MVDAACKGHSSANITDKGCPTHFAAVVFSLKGNCEEPFDRNDFPGSSVLGLLDL